MLNRQKRLMLLMVLILSFGLIRFVLFTQHGMKDWPVVMLVVGSVLLLISFLLKLDITYCLMSVGYVFSYLMGFVFQSDSYDLGGGLLNDLWKIWLISYLSFFVVGIFVDIIAKKRR